MGEKTWEERFPKYIQGYPKYAFGPMEYVKSLRDKPIRTIETYIGMTIEELREERICVWGNLESTFSQEVDSDLILLKPAGNAAPGAQVLICAPEPRIETTLKYYLNRLVMVFGLPIGTPSIQKDGTAEAVFVTNGVMECPPYDVWKEWEDNPAGKPRKDELRIALACKIAKNGKIKVAVIGPEKNGIDLFRKEFDALALKDPNLRKRIDWLPIPLSLMPRGYTVPAINKFYTELGKKLEKIAVSPDRFDVLCLVRGGGDLKDLTRLNNVPLWNATINIPVPICSALGENEPTLWLAYYVDDRADSPTELAHWLQRLVDLAQEMLKSGSTTVPRPTKPPTKNAGSAMMGAMPSAKAPKNTPNVAKSKATATKSKPAEPKPAAPKAAPKPAMAAKQKANPAASTATKPIKATATASTSTQKMPKAVKTSAPKTTRKTAAKTSKARTTKTTAIAKLEEHSKVSKKQKIALWLLLILGIIAAIVTYLEKYT